VRCRRAIRLLPLHSGGDLSPRLAAELEEHLDGCETCRRELGGLDASRQVLFRLKGAVGPTPDLWPALRERLAAEPVPSPRRLPFRAAAAAVLLAAAVVAAVVAPWMWDPGSEVVTTLPESTTRPAPEATPPAPAVPEEREYLLAEVSPAGTGGLRTMFPSVRPPDPDRGMWDDF